MTGPLAIATWLGLAPAAAYAQAEPLEPGREVRLYVRGVAAIFEGTLTALSADALAITLRDGNSFTFSPEQLERSQVRATRPNALRGALVGTGVGLGVGVALVISLRDDPCAGGGGGELGFTVCGAPFDGFKLVAPAVAGFFAGGLVGGFIRTPRWVPGFLPTAAGAPGDFAFGWTLSAG